MIILIKYNKYNKKNYIKLYKFFSHISFSKIKIVFIL